MILWNDFILDDVLGPTLRVPESCREEKRFGDLSVRMNAEGNIQETRQEQRPARMVGLSSHDSAQADRMSAGQNQTVFRTSRLEGEGT